MNQYETYPDAVRDLQTRLRRLAEDDSRLPQVPIDGVYASLTRQAVEDFQRLSGLTVTGIADPVTWAAVQQAYDALIARIDPPRGIFPFPLTSDDYALAPGEESDFAAILHLMLAALTLGYDDLGEIPEGRRYDARSERAVRQIQKKHGLAADGRVDRATWNAIAEAYNRLAAENQ